MEFLKIRGKAKIKFNKVSKLYEIIVQDSVVDVAANYTIALHKLNQHQ